MYHNGPVLLVWTYLCICNQEMLNEHFPDTTNSDLTNVGTDCEWYGITLTLKRQTKIAADDILIVYFYRSKKIRLEF